MARKTSRKGIIATIRHPDDPEIWVKVRKMSRPEALDFFGELNEGSQAVAIRGEDGSYLRNEKTQSLEVAFKQKFSSEHILKFLRKIVTDFGGILDEDGTIVQYSTENVDVLLDESLDVLKGQQGDTGAFWKHIMDVVTEEKIFDADPKTSASS